MTICPALPRGSELMQTSQSYYVLFMSSEVILNFRMFRQESARKMFAKPYRTFLVRFGDRLVEFGRAMPRISFSVVHSRGKIYWN